MEPNVFFIGASGNIGASVLAAVLAAHPDLSIDALVRSETDARDLKETYGTSVTATIGSLAELDLLETKAAEATIVIYCAPDVFQDPGIAALLAGLAKSSSPTTPKFYIHTSGAARIWDPPNGSIPGPRIWDDTLDLADFPSSPTTTHATTDALVASFPYPHVHTAIVSPSFVVGRSPRHTHAAPIIFPYLLGAMQRAGGAFVIDQGRNKSSFVDNGELARVYVALLEDAVRILTSGAAPRPEVWGPEGYYFASGLEVEWRGFVEGYLVPALRRCGGGVLAPEGKGTREMEMGEVVQMMRGMIGDGETAGVWSQHIAEGFGTAMRVRATRAERELGVKVGTGLEGLDDAVRVTLEMIKI
ncbi:hypothetical protein B0T18DRAFT_408308 [Schizothecium vesticola]|uniref:NAD(P)-binding domain-containing protein n=1 Tax=Schizothecium vesticola TaxID=314040 RepID=A0AA40K8N8_9PEZI|nr:hypothetical protein B0T18DRAFT_408308 [Schizothecium vesticola]